MSASGNRAGVMHSIQKFLLVIPGMFPREFDFDVDRSPIRDAVTPDISLAMVTDVDDTAVFCEELTYGVIPCDAAVLTESHDYLVL